MRGVSTCLGYVLQEQPERGKAELTYSLVSIHCSLTTALYAVPGVLSLLC